MQALRVSLHHVTIAVRDLEQALAFYRDLLGFRVMTRETAGAEGRDAAVLDTGNDHRLLLLGVRGEAKLSAWDRNDLQQGFRHLGFQVQNVDKTTARLKAANVPFTLDPLDATGGVRIAFFKDPEGNLLEVIQGSLDYHEQKRGPRRGVATNPQRRDLPRPSGQGELIFDHIAITVSDLEQAQSFYEEKLGLELLGQLFFHDERGFTITYLKAGLGVLELFSFSKPTTAPPRDEDDAVLGFKRIGFAVEEPADAAEQLQAAGVPVAGQPVPVPGGGQSVRFADPDGNPLELLGR
jgi:catechol 2,3-dioxygenase-like lactoylglutathione lyase family enzyme